MTPRDVAVTSGEKDRSHTLLVRLELRSLGEANIRQNIGGVDATQEGVAQ
jgi:LPS-assembly protein